MQIIVNIPVHTYIKKYLLKRFKCEEPVVITNNTLLGKLIIKNFQDTITRQTLKKNEYSNDLRVCFDADYFGKKGFSITPDNVYDFNSIVDSLFRRDIGMHIGLNFMFSVGERKLTISNFLNYFYIAEDELNVESIIKHFQRHPEDTYFYDFQMQRK